MREQMDGQRPEQKINYTKKTRVKEVRGDDAEVFSIMLEDYCERKSNMTAIMIVLGFSAW
jgi:hypothetical protein